MFAVKKALCALLALLLQQAAAAGPPLWPLALQLAGRTYELPDGPQQLLELPLGCQSDSVLAVQHRVPPRRQGAAQCAGALSFQTEGPTGEATTVWSAEQVGRGSLPAPCICCRPARSARGSLYRAARAGQQPDPAAISQRHVAPAGAPSPCRRWAAEPPG